MTCWCRCHCSIPSGTIAPDSRAAVDAATACDACRHRHCAVLLIRHPWYDPPAPMEPPPPALFTADPEE